VRRPGFLDKGRRNQSCRRANVPCASRSTLRAAESAHFINQLKIAWTGIGRPARKRGGRSLRMHFFSRPPAETQAHPGDHAHQHCCAAGVDSRFDELRDRQAARPPMARDVYAEAAIIADNSTAALSFHDGPPPPRRPWRRCTTSLKSSLPVFTGADGRVFRAVCPRRQPEHTRAARAYFRGSQICGKLPACGPGGVELGKEVIGRVYLRADLREGNSPHSRVLA